jgi:hypothetical protein
MGPIQARESHTRPAKPEAIQERKGEIRKRSADFHPEVGCGVHGLLNTVEIPYYHWEIP